MQIQPGLTPPLSPVSPTSAPATQNDTDTAPLSPTDDGKVPGVIRNLQNGHYKGVADVRLRIVHAEKLAALQAQQFAGALEGAADTVTSALQPVVNDLMTELEALAAAADAAVTGDGDIAAEIAEETADVIEADATDIAPDPLASFRAALQEVLAGGATTAASFTDAAQTAFQTLVEQLGLNIVAAEPAAEPDAGETATPADDTPATGDTGEPLAAAPSDAVDAEAGVVPPRDYLAELTAAFDAALQSVLDAAGAASALPPLSEPNGNGAAYAKFLAMYNDLQTDSSAAADSTAAGDGSDAGTGLDIEV